MADVTWMSRLEEGPPVLIENRATIVAVSQGRGTGDPCAYCDKEIAATAVQHRVEARVLGGVLTLHFHRVCHHLWESCEQPMGASEHAGRSGGNSSCELQSR